MFSQMTVNLSEISYYFHLTQITVNHQLVLKRKAEFSLNLSGDCSVICFKQWYLIKYVLKANVVIWRNIQERFSINITDWCISLSDIIVPDFEVMRGEREGMTQEYTYECLNMIWECLAGDSLESRQSITDAWSVLPWDIIALKLQLCVQLVELLCH